MTKRLHPAVSRENTLVGLTLISQLFDGPDSPVVDNAHDVYHNDVVTVTASMLTAAALMVKTYAEETGISVQEMAERIRTQVLNGEVDLPE